MNILYIYPHPDDESYGPASVMARQRRQGHHVSLLTLTKGGATKVRHKLGLSVEEMGEVRHREMLRVEKTLDLSSMTVLDLPDGQLKELDPRLIESVVAEEIVRLRPNVIVSYPVHGISGFHDHLIAHSVVKRVFVDLREKLPELRRYAMITLTRETAERYNSGGGPFHLHSSTDEEIDCVEDVEEVDIEANRNALRCYTTYLENIERSGLLEHQMHRHSFELFDEEFYPPLTDLFDRLPAARSGAERNPAERNARG